MLSARVADIHGDLLAFGETDTARWLLDCTDDELVRVCSVAKWLLYFGPNQPSGASMMIGKACALASVYVREGSPRDLARSRRLSKVAIPESVMSPSQADRRPPDDLQHEAGNDYGVGENARRFWARNQATEQASLRDP